MSHQTTRPAIILHMVSSLDGFIARKDNTVSWLDDCECVYQAGKSISEEEVAAFIKGVDCYLMGSRTYEHALQLGWPYGEKPCIVLTGRKLEPARRSVEFHSGDIKEILTSKLAPRFRNIWLVGGATLAQHFLDLGLIDEIRLTLAPVLLGDGLRLFGQLAAEKLWALKNATAYKNGFVELHYAAAHH